MISALDHVALVTPDLDAATARYAQLLGCAPNWRGAMGGAAHVWFQLDNMALDIVAPAGEGPMGDGVRANLAKNGEGLWAIAYATPDLDAAHRLLGRRGAKTTPAHGLDSRHVDTGETREWRMFSTTLAGVPSFLMQQAPWPRCAPDAAGAVAGLDHVVIRTPAPERAMGLYGARLGLDMRLDRTAPEWGSRLMFFRCGDLVVEIAHDLKAGVSDGEDALWGLTWRTADIEAAHARLAPAFSVSEIRAGRRPGTRVFTVRDGTCNVPTLFIEPPRQQGSD